MATLANIFNRFTEAAATADDVRALPVEDLDQFKLRTLPNEDVYFYFKRIDNSRVVREADPVAQQRSWKFLGLACVSAIGVIGMLLPNAYGLIANYQLHDLEAQHQTLVTERSKLDMQEAKLVSADRLEALASQQAFIDPTPERTIYLEKKNESAMAMNRH